MKHFFSWLILLFISFHVDGQKIYATHSGQIKLNTSASSETVIAVNDQAESRWLENNGQFFFSALLQDFSFESPKEKERFLEQYTENGKFPKLIIKGFIQDIQHIDLTSSGGNEVMIEANLAIHGITQKMVLTGSLTVLSSGKIMLKTGVLVKWKDFNIKNSDGFSKIVKEDSFQIYSIYE